MLSSPPPKLPSQQTPPSHETTHPPRPLPLRREWCGVGGRIFDVAFSPTTQHELATAGEDCGIVWSTGEGAAPSPRLKLASKRPAVRCAWHPAGKHLLTGSTDGLVTVFSAVDGSSLASLRAAKESEPSEVYGLASLSNESLLAVACSDTIQQWDLPRGRLTAHTQLAALQSSKAYGGTRNPHGRAFVFGMAARGRVLAAALSDGTCRLIDSQTCREHGRLEAHAASGSAVFACALSTTSPTLATAAADGAVLLWDLRAYTRGPLAQIRGHTQAVHGVCFAAAGSLGSPVDGGELLVTGGSDSVLRIHETRGATCVCAVRSSGPVLCTAFAPAIDGSSSGARVGVGGGSGTMSSRGGPSDNNLSIFSAQPPVALDSPPAAAAAIEAEAKEVAEAAAAAAGQQQRQTLSQPVLVATAE